VVLPTEPGWYLVVKRFTGNSHGYDSAAEYVGGAMDPALEGPGWRAESFTRLRRESDVALEVLADIKDIYGENFLDNSNAGWNKVSEKWATK
jgi:hypothetical protein